MAKAKQQTNRVIRATDAEWTVNGATPGEIEKKTVRVLFYSPTIQELKDAAEEVQQYFKNNPDSPYFVSNVLIKRLHSLPDFNVGEGQPDPLTVEWLDAQDLVNLESVQEAIKGELNPKSQAAK